MNGFAAMEYMYVAEVLATGPRKKIRQLFLDMCISMRSEGRAQYAKLGDGILCLHAFTASRDAAALATIELTNRPCIGEIVVLDSWPNDVSGWEQAKFRFPESDADHLMFIPALGAEA